MAQQGRTIKPDADGAPAECGIFFLEGGDIHIGQHFIAADIKRAKDRRMISRCIKHCGIKLDLVFQARQFGGDHELQFGAEQADAFGTGFVQMPQIDLQTGVDIKRDGLAVLRDGRLMPDRLILFLLACAEAGFLRIGINNVRRRTNINIARIAIENDGVALINIVENGFGTPHRDDTECARDDGDMGIRRALFEHQPAQAHFVVIQQFSRTHVAGNQDRVVGQITARRRQLDAGELAQQPVRQIIEIMQPVAQIRISGA